MFIERLCDIVCDAWVTLSSPLNFSLVVYMKYNIFIYLYIYFNKYFIYLYIYLFIYLFIFIYFIPPKLFTDRTVYNPDVSEITNNEGRCVI